MPHLCIDTNVSMERDTAAELAGKASGLIAQALGKPVGYCQAMVRPGAALVHGGTDAPAAFVTLKSIGLPEDRTAQLSEELCDFLRRELAISPERVYIDFADLQRHLFGWNSGTF
jgi:hypothetical protein